MLHRRVTPLVGLLLCTAMHAAYSNTKASSSQYRPASMHTNSEACKTPVRAFTESGGTAVSATTALHTAAAASVSISATALATAPVYTTAAAAAAAAAPVPAAAAAAVAAVYAAAASAAADVEKLQLMHKIVQQCLDRSDSAELKLESISFLVQSAAVQEAATRSTPTVAAAAPALLSAEAAVLAELKRLQQMHRLLLQTVDCSDGAESKLASITFIVAC
eukprot:4663-Heterococcus_DN1.PRE.6